MSTLETSSLIDPSFLIFLDNSISFRGSNIWNLINCLKFWSVELNDFKEKDKFDKTKSITKWEKANTLDCW